MRKKFMIEWSGIKPYIVGYLEQLCKKNDDYTELHDQPEILKEYEKLLKSAKKLARITEVPLHDHIPLHQKQDECVEGCKIKGKPDEAPIDCDCPMTEEGYCVACGGYLPHHPKHISKPIKPTEIEELPFKNYKGSLNPQMMVDEILIDKINELIVAINKMREK